MSITLKEHIYNFDVQYESRELNPVLSADSCKLHSKRPQIAETVLVDEDRRVLIDNTTEFPHSIHTKIESHYHGRGSKGSGALVGPHHVLTCAHNIFNNDYGGFAHSVNVYPGKNGVNNPFGEVSATKVFLFSNYTDQIDKKYDIALLVLERSVGKSTGWAGLFCTLDEELKDEEIHLVGYPSDKPRGTMWMMSNKIKDLSAERLTYDIDTHSGQSGSAIYIDRKGEPLIVGVHTHGTHGGNINSGTRISTTKITELLINTISKTYKIKEDIFRSTLHLEPNFSRGLNLKAICTNQACNYNGEERWYHQGFGTFYMNEICYKIHCFACNERIAIGEISRDNTRLYQCKYKFMGRYERNRYIAIEISTEVLEIPADETRPLENQPKDWNFLKLECYE